MATILISRDLVYACSALRAVPLVRDLTIANHAASSIKEMEIDVSSYLGLRRCSTT